MNKICIAALFLFVFLVHLSAQIKELNPNNYESVSTDRLCLRLVNKSNDCMIFEFINKSDDSLYLFDCYLNEISILSKENLYDTKYLHRYDEKTKQCKISFLPLLPYLSVEYVDLTVIGEKRFVRKGQIIYHFSPIPPKGKLYISIPGTFFYSKKYVKDISLKSFSIFDKRIKFDDILKKECDQIIVEFAIYKNIDLLTSIDAYYLDEIRFNEQALSYEIFSILIDL